MYSKRPSTSTQPKPFIDLIKDIQKIRTQNQNVDSKQSQAFSAFKKPLMMRVYRDRSGRNDEKAKPINIRYSSIVKQLEQFRKQWDNSVTQVQKSNLDDGTVLSVNKSSMRSKPSESIHRNQLKRRVKTEYQQQEKIINQSNMINSQADLLPQKESRENKTFKVHNKNTEEPYQSQYCFMIDLSSLDDVKPDDQKLRKTLTENFWSQTQLDVDQFVEDNSEYLLHQLGQCACGKCTCGQCTCQYKKTQYPYHQTSTTYNTQFTGLNQSTHNKIDALNQTHYQNLFQLDGQNQLEPQHPTAHRTAYQQYPLQPKFKRKHLRLMHNPFLSKTLNQHQFPNWKDCDPNWIFHSPIHHSVVEDFNHLAKASIYNDSFCKTKQNLTPNKDALFVKNRQAHQTFMRSSPDTKESHYQKNYPTFKIKDVPNTYLPYKFKTETEVYEPKESFQGQFRNSHSIWYKPPVDTREIVLQNPWKNKLITQLKLLHSNKEVLV